MHKIPTGPETMIYPQPIVLIGAKVNDKPNFLAVIACGVACTEPPMISVAIRHSRYTDRGIRQNMTFSINLPYRDMFREADYCGIVSGSKVNKVEACQFKIFYGKLANAPLIEQCPINLERKVIHIMDQAVIHFLLAGLRKATHQTDASLMGNPTSIKFSQSSIFDSHHVTTMLSARSQPSRTVSVRN